MVAWQSCHLSLSNPSNCMTKLKHSLLLASLALAALGLAACGKKSSGAVTIRTAGSTTLAPIVTAWAEEYAVVTKEAAVTVSAGGSGVGINELIEGRIDIANSSRPLKGEEKEKIKEKHGKEAVEFVIGYDALAVFTNNGNPLQEISIEQLHGIYAKGGTISKWDQIAPGGLTDDIRVLGRESNSGTGEYFKEAVCGKGPDGKHIEFRTGIAEMNSSQAVIDTLSSTKNAIAYDGMAFKTDKVHWLAVSKKTGEAAVLPSAEDARSGKYPLARKLYLYTIGQPEGEVKKFIDWALSPDGQALVAKTGAVSLQ